MIARHQPHTIPSLRNLHIGPVAPSPLMPRGVAFTPPSREQFHLAFMNFHPVWHPTIVTPTPKPSILNKNLLTDDDTPHPGDYTDLMSAAYTYAKPYLSQALAGIWEDYRGKTAGQKWQIGTLLVTGVAPIAAAVLTNAKSRQQVLDWADGTFFPVPGAPAISVGIGWKCMQPDQASGLVDMGKHTGIPLAVKVDLSDFLQSWELRHSRNK